MTLQEFDQKIKKKNLFDRYWYKGLGISTTALGLVLLILLATEPKRFSGSHKFHYTAFFGLVSIGVIVLYKLPNRFKILSIPNSRTSTEKERILKEVVEYFDSAPVSTSDNYIYFRYSPSLFRITYDVHLFYDEEQAALSIQGQGSGGSGFIDFGAAERLRKQFRDEIELRLT